MALGNPKNKIVWLVMALFFLWGNLGGPEEAFAAQAVILEDSVFPDPVFLQYIKRFDMNHDGIFSEFEIESIKTVDVSAMGISSLEGIQLLGALEELNCYNNQITELDIRANEQLSSLNCGKNQLSSLDVSRNPKLKILNCNDNVITEIDLRPLTELRQLYVAGNQIAELDVECSENLEVLYCSGNQLSRLSLGKLDNLVRLDCSKNKIQVLDLQKSKDMEYINSSENQLSEIRLGNKPLVSYMLLSHNRLIELNLGSIPKLRELYVSDNRLEHLEVSECPELKTLSCYNNVLKELDMGKNQGLQVVHCYNNQLLSLDLEKNTALENWYLSPQTRGVKAWKEEAGWIFMFDNTVTPAQSGRIAFADSRIVYNKDKGQGVIRSTALPEQISYAYDNQGKVTQNNMMVTLLLSPVEQVYNITFQIRAGDEAYGSIFSEMEALPEGIHIPREYFQAVPASDCEFDGWYCREDMIEPGQEVVVGNTVYEARFYPDKNKNKKDDRNEQFQIAYSVRSGDEAFLAFYEALHTGYGTGLGEEEIPAIGVSGIWKIDGYYLEGRKLSREELLAYEVKTNLQTEVRTFPDENGSQVDDRIEEIPVSFRIQTGQEAMGSLSCDTYHAIYGETIRIGTVCKVTPAEGYEFIGWYLNGKRVEAGSVVIKESVIYRAAFRPMRKHIDGGDDDGGNLKPAWQTPETVPETEPRPVPAEEYEGNSQETKANSYQKEMVATETKANTVNIVLPSAEETRKTEDDSIKITISRISGSNDSGKAIPFYKIKNEAMRETLSFDKEAGNHMLQKIRVNHCIWHTILMLLALILEWLLIFERELEAGSEEEKDE